MNSHNELLYLMHPKALRLCLLEDIMFTDALHQQRTTQGLTDTAVTSKVT